MAEYNKITAEILEQLKAAAPGHILTGEDVNADYGRDEMPIYGREHAGSGPAGDFHRGDRCGREDLQ